MGEWIQKLVTKLYPLIRWISTIHFPFTKKKVTGVQYFYWLQLLKPGDIFLTSTRGEFSNWINPSQFKHGAIYYGFDVDMIPSVYEATKKGVHYIDLVSFLTSKDRIIILRNKGMRVEDEIYFLEFFEDVDGLPYDDQFSTANKKYYCFELLAKALEYSIDKYEAPMEKIFGSLVYTSDSFLKDKDNWEIIVDY